MSTPVAIAVNKESGRRIELLSGHAKRVFEGYDSYEVEEAVPDGGGQGFSRLWTDWMAIDEPVRSVTIARVVQVGDGAADRAVGDIMLWPGERGEVRLWETADERNDPQQTVIRATCHVALGDVFSACRAVGHYRTLAESSDSKIGWPAGAEPRPARDNDDETVTEGENPAEEEEAEDETKKLKTTDSDHPARECADCGVKLATADDAVPWDEQCPECGRASILTVDIGIKGPVSDVSVDKLGGRRLVDEHQALSRAFFESEFSTPTPEGWKKWASNRVAELWGECFDRSAFHLPKCDECGGSQWSLERSEGWVCQSCCETAQEEEAERVRNAHLRILGDVRDGLGPEDSNNDSDDGPDGPGPAPVATDGGEGA